MRHGHYHGPPRSIPACAGKPRLAVVDEKAGGVYPRVCGETSCVARSTRVSGGLSPRVRGNPETEMKWINTQGSIPACAGKPECLGRSLRRGQVYPRVCGETRIIITASDGETGLSPRVRGNRLRLCRLGSIYRSIPACAGKPRQKAGQGHKDRVYPRVCGETV